MSDKRHRDLLHALDSDRLSQLRGRVPTTQLVDMLLCEIQRARQIADGRPYYDYSAQIWIEN